MRTAIKSVRAFVACEPLESRRLFQATPLSAVDPTGSVSAQDAQLRAYIVAAEGERLYPYRDSRGMVAIGVGCDIDPASVGRPAAMEKLAAVFPGVSGKRLGRFYQQLLDEAQPAVVRGRRGRLVSNPSHPPNAITKDQAQALLSNDLSAAMGSAERIVDKYNGHDARLFGSLNHRQQVALVDLAFDGDLKSSQHAFLGDLGLHHWHAAGQAMPTPADANRAASDRHLLADVLDHFALSKRSVAAGQTFPLTAVPLDAEGYGVALDSPLEEIDWSGSAPDAATLGTAAGLTDAITGVAKGRTIVTVRDALWGVATGVRVAVNAVAPASLRGLVFSATVQSATTPPYSAAGTEFQLVMGKGTYEVVPADGNSQPSSGTYAYAASGDQGTATFHDDVLGVDETVVFAFTSPHAGTVTATLADGSKQVSAFTY